MVVDANGLVRLHNRHVAELLGDEIPELDQIERYSEEFASHLVAWRSGKGGAAVTARMLANGKLVRLRFVEAGAGGGSFALIFIEDISVKISFQNSSRKIREKNRICTLG